MNTKKEKQRQPPVRRPVLLEAQKFLSKEIDEWSKMSDLDDSRFKVRPPVVFEPSEIVGEKKKIRQKLFWVCLTLSFMKDR